MSRLGRTQPVGPQMGLVEPHFKTAIKMTPPVVAKTTQREITVAVTAAGTF